MYNTSQSPICRGNNKKKQKEFFFCIHEIKLNIQIILRKSQIEKNKKNKNLM